MKLKDMELELDYELQQGTLETEVTALVYDSRKVVPGCMFVCISGTTVDAHTFIPKAVKDGARVIVAEHEVEAPQEITVLVTRDNRRALAYLAAAWFGHPARKMTTIGITGTKGKTTTSYTIQAMLAAAGKKVGVIGTIGAVIDGKHVPTHNTTPESYEIQSLFAEMADAGCEYVVMEVSSQGLKMHRVDGFLFDIGIFTNFSEDHIGPNEHASMEEYLYCKSLLFTMSRHSIVNRDDPVWDKVSAVRFGTRETYGFSEDADLRLSDLKLFNENGKLGITFRTSGILNETVNVATPGKFSAYNAAAGLAAGCRLGLSFADMQKALLTVHVPGRVEIVPVSEHFSVIIDYAHNAVSVESLLTTIREYRPKRLVCVFGGGGNRSRLRRYDMGELCGRMADLSILTCDNPRDEEVAAINADIRKGFARSKAPDGGEPKILEIPDRKDAIWYAFDHAEEGDVILLLGKGHETYQEIKGVKYPYSERGTVEAYKEARGLA